MSAFSQSPIADECSPQVDGVKIDRPLVVIGTGNVGGELLSLLQSRPLEGVSLVGVANSRSMHWNQAGISLEDIEGHLRRSDQKSDLDRLEGWLLAEDQPGIIVDLTASPDVAARHTQWLGAGLSVVTANKWAAAGDPGVYRALTYFKGQGIAPYRYATTVGAGLPLLDSLQRLRSAGESILNVSGLFSGTLSYLMQGLGQGRGLAECLWEAHEQGLTEPDPRLDLSGVDVARKLVITARAAGFELSLGDVRIQSLVPDELQHGSLQKFLSDGGSLLDAHWAHIQARGEAGVPRYVGQVDSDGRASVGIQWLPKGHPFVAVGPTDNVFEIRSDSYLETPLIVRGPGAGSRVTAVQVLADIHSLL